SFALLALAGEPGAGQVGALLSDASNENFISVINLGEVFYMTQRRRGEEAARQAWDTAFQEPNLAVVEATSERVRLAAEIKAGGRLSYADAFAAALARELSAPLVTGDPEFRALERAGTIEVVWLPQR